MSEKSKVTERSYCSYCDTWQEPGDEHDWEKHPPTVHGWEAEDGGKPE